MSLAVFAKKVITISTQNKHTGISNENGLARNVRSRRFPTNLMTRNTHTCKHSLCALGDTPQSSVRNNSSFLRKRVNNCIGTTCEHNNFKLQNPLNSSVSAHIRRISDQSRQCAINTSEYNKNLEASCFTVIVNGVPIQKYCSRPIVQTTDVPNISQFLRSQHLKNNCLPEQNMHFTKILKPKNCYASNAGC